MFQSNIYLQPETNSQLLLPSILISYLPYTIFNYFFIVLNLHLKYYIRNIHCIYYYLFQPLLQRQMGIEMFFSFNLHMYSKNLEKYLTQSYQITIC